MTTERSRIDGLGEIAERYDGILCDVWGVLHNGVASWKDAAEGLRRFRQQGGTVTLITNAPRPHEPIIAQLARLGVGADSYNAVVTSGDVTRMLIDDMAREVYHLGPDRDLTLYEGLDVELVDAEAARAVVCTGLVDDLTETPDDYRDLLKRLQARGLPFICANPDIVVERGDNLIWCAGALARDYRALGGEVHIVGKPHRPIYERAMAVMEAAAGRKIEKDRVLAIGDGMETDVAGALGFGLDLLYVSSGIHSEEYGDPDQPDVERLERFLAEKKARPTAWLPRLKW